MAPRIAKIADRHLKDPVRVLVAREQTPAGTLPKVRQVAYVVSRAQKVAALGLVLDIEAPTLALVFCRTRIEVDTLAENLGGHGYRVQALHGGMTQEQRDRVMKRTRGGSVDVLVATDVAARGLDIEQITHVVNFNVPESPQTYVHRIGRTGRAGREGVAITFAEPREHRLMKSIEQLTRQRIAVEQLPTVLDVRAKQLELTRGALREAILAGELEHYRVVVESLAGEFDVLDIAAAAVQLAHAASDGAGTREPVAAPVEPAPGKPTARSSSRTPGMSRIFIGAGRLAKMRPADLVGAIVNEAGIDAGTIGAIEVADRYSTVELPDDLVDRVVMALRKTTIKGKKQTVRRDLAQARSGRAARGS
jgi:ATP-dependent RNA helicase DeaD